MLRILVLAAVLFLVAVMILRPRSLKRTLYVLEALAVVYTVLKLTGVIEAVAPDRTGVF